MLDDANILEQHDSRKDLILAGLQYEQTNFKVDIKNSGEHQPVYNVVVAGMGGSALAALLVKSWLKSELVEPLEIVRTYDLPAYVDHDTLVIISSYSGNTEETVSCLEQAKKMGAQIVVIASGGQLIDQANANQIAHVILPVGFQPRMAMIYTLCSIVEVLAHFNIVSGDKLDEIASKSDWLKSESDKWIGNVPTYNNYAKQLALQAVGKTAVFFSGTFSFPVAYKWKTCFNETAKNLAFLCEFPEFNHNEILGWTSHPVEKPFAVFDIVSNLEHPQILKRFEISDRLLSGQRPKSTVIHLAGESAIEQLLWGSILADFVSIYIAILNGVSPMSVQLIEKLKEELK